MPQYRPVAISFQFQLSCSINWNYIIHRIDNNGSIVARVSCKGHIVPTTRNTNLHWMTGVLHHVYNHAWDPPCWSDNKVLDLNQTCNKVSFILTIYIGEMILIINISHHRVLSNFIFLTIAKANMEYWNIESYYCHYCITILNINNLKKLAFLFLFQYCVTLFRYSYLLCRDIRSSYVFQKRSVAKTEEKWRVVRISSQLN